MMNSNSHSFVILAYKNSEFLEECVRSVLNQTIGSMVVIATSTPNRFIRYVADKYGLKVIVNAEKGGIAADFDFALSCTDSELVTIAHQDDIYDQKYLESLLKVVDDEMLIAFTDSHELKNDRIEKTNVNLFIKRCLLFLLRFRLFQGCTIIKRLCLSFGNPICCPSVMFNRSLTGDGLFISDFKSNMDWFAWTKLSVRKGRFIYLKYPFVIHRIHKGSATSSVIRDKMRVKEDLEMFRQFWPEPIAYIIGRIYGRSEINNS